MITCKNYFFLIKTRHRLWTFLYISTGSNNGQITSLWLVSIGTTIIVIIVWFKEFGNKNALFGYFWARISKSYCYIWNQHPRICLIAKFYDKTKVSKFGTRDALFGYFWAKILKKLLSYLKSAPLNLSKVSLQLIQWILV